MYTLYYTTRSYTSESTSLIPRIALEEMGLEYEATEVELDPAPPDWYRAINPHGKVPTLIERRADWSREAVIYPSSAILLYLADAHPDSALFPRGAPERGQGFRVLFDMAEMLQSAFMMYFYPARFCADREEVPSVRGRALEWLSRYWERIDKDLGQSPYLVGNRYSICDIYLYVLARWYVDVANRDGAGSLKPFRELRHVAASCGLAEARPAVARALAADQIDSIAREL